MSPCTIYPIEWVSKVNGRFTLCTLPLLLPFLPKCASWRMSNVFWLTSKFTWTSIPSSLFQMDSENLYLKPVLIPAHPIQTFYHCPWCLTWKLQVFFGIAPLVLNWKRYLLPSAMTEFHYWMRLAWESGDIQGYGLRKGPTTSVNTRFNKQISNCCWTEFPLHYWGGGKCGKKETKKVSI